MAPTPEPPTPPAAIMGRSELTTEPKASPVEKAPTEEYRRYLVELYSPVIFQKMSSHPEWDIPLLIDYDNNEDPRETFDVATWPNVTAFLDHFFGQQDDREFPFRFGRGKGG